jgi:ubiquinone/menaquinone biosynthesis C-methylase UbiE
MTEKEFFNKVFLSWRSKKDSKNFLYDKYARLIEDGGDNIRCYPAKKHYDELLHAKGNKILDCACGAGELAIWLALNGMEVYAFDFSETALKIARISAELSGVADKIKFSVMDVRELHYADDFFDILTGNDCLHHLIKWPAGIRELARVLKPGGRALFVEPLAWNPFINLLRGINTWRNRYYYEHFLSKKDMEFLKGVFGKVYLSEHVVLSSFTRLMAKSHAGGRLNSFQRRACILLRRIDARLIRLLPAFRNLASMAYVRLVKSKK